MYNLFSKPGNFFKFIFYSFRDRKHEQGRGADGEREREEGREGERERETEIFLKYLLIFER